MRIVMGPLCDKFGARLCMASVLLASAMPCAMTGLVETSHGLTTVRAFVGIAGASFVACQYWTSSMFTREVAGTANALVAGWVSRLSGFSLSMYVMLTSRVLFMLGTPCSVLPPDAYRPDSSLPFH